MNCKYNNCKICGYKSECEIYKENAELKEELKDADEKVVHLACNQDKDLKRKLTKAKEIIKDLLGSENQYCEEEMFFTIRKRAEDFIKDI